MSKHNKGGYVKVQDPISGKCYFYDWVPTGRIKRLRKGKTTNGYQYKTEDLSWISLLTTNKIKTTRWNRH